MPRDRVGGSNRRGAGGQNHQDGYAHRRARSRDPTIRSRKNAGGEHAVHERKRRSLSAWCDRAVDVRFRSRIQGLFVGRLDGEARLCRMDGRLPQLRLLDAREGDGRTGREKSAGDRSYLALRDIEAMVNHIKRTRGVQKVSLIGWSWGAMMAGYYASLHSENVHKLVLYAPLYNFNDHTNLGPGSALQNKRKPYEFNFALGAYRFASEAANTGRWNGEIPLDNKDEYRDAAVPAAFWSECMATDPSSNTRNPPSLRAPNGVLEDSFYQATGRPLWSASNIYAPTLLIAGAYDTWSYPEDREGLMRDLVHAPVKRSVLIPDATHFVLFEKNRIQFFEEVLKFLKQ